MDRHRFFVTKELEANKYQPFLVSNKHIFDNKEIVYIRLKQRNGGELLTIPIKLIVDGVKQYSEHPNSRIDIAVILINGSMIMENNLNFSFFNIDDNSLTTEEFLEAGGNEGSGIFMLGFPMGLVDVNSIAPICRTGCIARIDKTEIRDTKNILLDIQNFPGNSGSPIISKPELVSVSRTKALNRCVLLGVIHSYIPYQETLVNSQTGRTVEIRSENSGIAKANPVEFIKEVVAGAFLSVADR